MNIFRNTGCLTLLIMSMASGLSGQVGGIGDPAITPGTPAQSYALSGLDHVNYYNGNLNVSIPLLTFGGRGTVSRTPTIEIGQRWTVLETTVGSTPQAPLRPMGPMVYALGMLQGVRVSGNPNGCLVQSEQGDWFYRGLGPFTTYMRWTTAGGSEVILEDTKFNGQPQGADITDCSQLDSYQAANRGRVFRSKDGANWTFVADEDVVDRQSWLIIPGTLISSDGTKMRIDSSGYVSQIEDRNGNLIKTVFQPTDSGGTYTVTDAAGRQETIQYSDSFASAGPDVFTYPGYLGNPRSITVNYAALGTVLSDNESLQTPHCLFPELNGSSVDPYNPQLISSIVLPDNTTYTMKYNAYGELTELTLPTGGMYRYKYAEAAGCAAGTGSGVITLANDSGYRISRRVLEREEYADGVHLSAKILFSTVSSSTNLDPNHSTRPGLTTTVTYQNPSGSLLREEKHYFYGDPLSTSPPPADQTKYAEWWLGLEFKTEIGDGSIILQKQEHVYRQRPCAPGEPCWFDPQADNSPPQDIQLCQTNTTLGSMPPAGQIFDYDRYNNVTNRWEFDYGSAPAIGASCPASPTTGYVRVTSNSYVTQSAYTDPSVNLIGLIASTTVNPGNFANTVYTYDEPGTLFDAPGVIGHDSAFGLNHQIRGNLTTISQQSSSLNKMLSTKMTYDIAGEVLSSTDPKQHTTKWAYTFPIDPPNGYGVTETNALNQNTGIGYEPLSGRVQSLTHLNNLVTYLSYQSDPLDRPSVVCHMYSWGGSENDCIGYQYSSPTARTETHPQDTTGHSIKVDYTYDHLGRLVSTDNYESSSQYVSTSQTYDALSRVDSVSNPTRTGDATLWTQYKYDALGRIKEITAPDGAKTTMMYSGNTVTITDPGNRIRVNTTDALGRLTQVQEGPQGASEVTVYSYDASNNLVKVTQGSQIRSFTYDTLGWLVNTTQPESGTMSYEYDEAGNITKRTDARNSIVTYTYDDLNRLIGKTYLDGAPTVQYTYDGKDATPPLGSLAVGQLTQVSNGNATSAITGFDRLGRVANSRQSINGQTYDFSYTYDRTGALISETYPSNRTVYTCYDGAGRPLQISLVSTCSSNNYVSNVSYAAHGAPAAVWYGNGIVPVTQYNEQLQPTINYATRNNNPDSFLWVQQYTHRTPTMNNGDIMGGMEGYGDGVPYGSLSWFSQSFDYDNFGRLHTASDSGGWSRTFGYDRFGNMWVSAGTNIGMQTPTAPDWIDSTTNRLKTQPGVIEYDASGNLTRNGGMQMEYDAENRLTAETLNGIKFRYLYDGTGRRVRKCQDDGAGNCSASGADIVYVYDAFAQLAAEYHAGSGTATPCATCYLITDQVGSARLVTDATGTVVARRDYLPFGEELSNSYGREATAGWGQPDNVNQHFTGQERDQESQLDFFQARYYTAAQGRFTSADPMNAGADPFDPQSWNAYAYVRNNPLALVDPSGLCDSKDPGCFSIGTAACKWWQIWCWAGGPSASDTESANGGWDGRDLIHPGGNGSLSQASFPPQPPVPLLLAFNFTVTATANPPKNVKPLDDCTGLPDIDKFKTAAITAIGSYPRDQFPIPWLRGIMIHSTFTQIVRTFPNTSVNVPYKNGAVAGWLTFGSVRPDAVYGNVNSPKYVLELKTGGARLTNPQLSNYHLNLPPKTRICEAAESVK